MGESIFCIDYHKWGKKLIKVTSILFTFQFRILGSQSEKKIEYTDWKKQTGKLLLLYLLLLMGTPSRQPPGQAPAHCWPLTSSAAARDPPGSPPLTTCTPSQAGTPVTACHTRTLTSPTAVRSHNAQNSGLTVTQILAWRWALTHPGYWSSSSLSALPRAGF